MIAHVTIEPGKKAATILARFDKVGVKCGWYSWYVNEKDIPKNIFEKLGDRVRVTKLDGRMTLNSVKRALDKAEE